MRADPRYKPLPPEPATLLAEGKLHEAVAALRKSHHLGQREARAWIDSHISDDPMLHAQLESGQRARRRRFFFWFLLVDILVVAAIIWYFNHLPR